MIDVTDNFGRAKFECQGPLGVTEVAGLGHKLTLRPFISHGGELHLPCQVLVMYDDSDTDDSDAAASDGADQNDAWSVLASVSVAQTFGHRHLDSACSRDL